MKRSGTRFEKSNLNKGLRLSLVAIITIFLGLMVPASIGSASQSCPTIDEKYAQPSSAFLGAPISGEIVAADGIGHFRNYEHGTIYWTENTCAHELHDEVLNKYLSQDYDFWYKMGYPSTDVENSRDNGNYAYFQGGAIFWKERTGAHALRGDILHYWEDKGRENSIFGYPMTDIMPSNDMKYNAVYFEKRIIYAGTPQNSVLPFDEYYQKEEPGFGCTPLSLWEACLKNPPPPPPVITHWKIPNQPTDVYRIDGPIVWSPANQIYPDIKLKPGDNVTISAGGCVQTGGTGSTWHRYVESYRTDHNYYGSAQIDGAIPNGIALDQGVLNKAWPVDVSPSGENDFWLDYYDDHPGGDSDNSYDRHDDGPDDQCEDVGPAWVVVTVEHNRTIPSEPPKAFDVVKSKFSNVRLYDDNFLLLNPRWGL